MRLPFLLSFLAMAFCAVSQPPIVSVTVTDSVQLEADEILYLIAVNDDYTAVDSVATIDTASVRPSHPVQPAPNPSYEAVRRIIRELRLDTVATEKAYTVNNLRYRSAEAAVQIRFSSAANLRAFVARIRSLDNVTGVVVQAKASREEEGLRRLYQKLLTKARKQAETLAQQAGKKLGSVHSVEEQPAEETGGWTMYPPLSAIPGWHTTLRGPSSVGEYAMLQRQLVVRFYWQ